MLASRCVLLAAALAGLALPAADGATLDELRAVYAKATAALEAEVQRGAELALTRYGEALAAVRAERQQAGDFDGTQAATAEQERFAAERTLPDRLPPALGSAADAARTAREARVEAGRRHDERLLVLSQQYAQELRRLLKDLMQRDRMDEAAAVNDEIKKTEFAIADLQARGSGAPAAPPAETVTLPLALRRGLVLHYGFDREAGRTAADAGGKRNDGELRGARWTPQGRVGGGVECSGEAATVVSGRGVGIVGAAPRSVAFWAKVQPLADRRYHRVIGWGGAGKGGQFVVATHGRNWGIWGYGMDFDWPAGPPVDADAWHHHVIACGESGATAWYADGRLAASAQKTRRTLDGPLTIGGSPTLKTVDEVMVWDRELTADEVRQLLALFERR